MKEKFERALYGNHWIIWHSIISIIVVAFILSLLKICDIQFEKLFSIINENTISLSAAIAGFVFAGMSIFISMDGSKKMAAVKAIGKDNIIYNVLISAIVFFVVSLLLMLIDINVLNFNIAKIILMQKIVKLVIEVISIYTFLLGFVFFFSSLKLIYWIFK
ncbi:hypothetical protein [Massilicoli timonensis]|uniref:hypothetical protein n=1 Tax=Massilicoli timonensis TaxID=2015901 RepID=UPI0030790E46